MFVLLLGAVVMSGCGHTDPFSTPPQGNPGPFDPTPPVRLTLNPGSDRSPAWLPDGSGIVYSAQQLTRPDEDICLAVLPAAGGTQLDLRCDVPGSTVGTDPGDMTDGVETPAVAPDGRLAFLGTASTIGGTNPGFQALRLAATRDAGPGTEVLRLPYTIEGRSHTAVTGIRWLDPDRLVYIGQVVSYRSACEQCPLDTLPTGVDVATLAVALPGSPPSLVPGTERASGLAPSPGGDAIFYTLEGDTRVYRRTLSSGAVTVVHDFGTAGIARDLHLSGSRLAATVGGRVHFGIHPFYPELGEIQRDSGGVVHVLDLDSDTDQVLDDPGHLFRRPAVAPAGDQLVAEGYQVLVSPNGLDTTVSRVSDLFLLEVPQ